MNRLRNALEWMRVVPVGHGALRVPLTLDETQRVERVIAVGRVFMASIAFIVALLSPAPTDLLRLVAYAMLLAYVVQSLLVLILVRVRNQSTPLFRFAVHVVDLIWASFATMVAHESSGLFLLFLVFTLLAAAYRWGFRETLATALWTIVLLGAGNELLSRILGHPLLAVHELTMRSAYLLIFGLLLGYLAEEDKQLRSEGLIIGRLLSRVQEQRALGETLKVAAHEMMTLFTARAVVFVLQAIEDQRVFIWSFSAGRPDQPPNEGTRALEVAPGDSAIYGFTPLGQTWHAVSRSRGDWRQWRVLTLANDGRRARRVRVDLPERFLQVHPCRALLSVSSSFPDEWTARIFLFDPRMPGIRATGLSFLTMLAQQMAPAVYNVYLMRRLRARAGAIERARVSRELHDGVIQSLLGLEMRLHVARAHAGDLPAHAEDLRQIQKALRDEILNLRELMQQMRPADVSPRELLDYLAAFVERFERETGIAARFVSDLSEIHLSSRACREVARIVQEALVNVRRHSGASNVVVRLSRDEAGVRLLVDDNGLGFAFEGRLSQADLDFTRRGPIVIKERVRALGGHVTIESNPGRGSRLDIVLPLN